ncbi:hypothetical protein J1N35_032635 [Gossypium stocksii]|uniref:Uncharacterized protein n=1 Tax=Gossypium stocksii TaxID=47602 RepID=A0A9D3V3X4_9ROSI|nr:hypothetical protein J1N35_032635 [Gossypium stocksii]
MPFPHSPAIWRHIASYETLLPYPASRSSTLTGSVTVTVIYVDDRLISELQDIERYGSKASRGRRCKVVSRQQMDATKRSSSRNNLQ